MNLFSRRRSESPKAEWGKRVQEAREQRDDWIQRALQAVEEDSEREEKFETRGEAREENKKSGEKKRVCGNIHKKEYREFWMEIAENDVFVRKVIEEGYRLQFESEPEEYAEKNNKSALENEEFVSEKVAEMLEEGVISRAERKPTCISPITVAVKINPDGTKKKRFCWDGSRMVNQRLKKMPVKFADLQRAAEITEKGDYMFVYDLKSCYYHVNIHEDSKKYLAFEWKGVVYQYNVLPFGLATAAAVVTRLTKPVCGYIHAAGHRHSIYIDDGKGAGRNQAEAERARKFVISTMEKAGFVISAEKSDREGEASKRKRYLGLIIDSEKMAIFTPEEKKSEVRKIIGASLGQRQTAKEKAQVVGKIIALEPALGRVVQLLTKSAQADIAKVSDAHGWAWRMTWSAQAEEELRTLAAELDELDGHKIEARHKDKKLTEVLAQADRAAVSDASATGTCAYALKGDRFFVVDSFKEEEKQMSSGLRELFAIKKAVAVLKKRGYRAPSQQSLLWITDSSNLVAFMTKGSMKRHIQQEVFQLYKECKRLGFTITPWHLSRNDPRIQLADTGSRVRDKDSWSIDHESFARLESELGSTDIDIFADVFNRKKKRFGSLFGYGNPEFVNAFSVEWSKLGRVYACPPIDEIVTTVRRLEEDSKAEGILVIPAWKTGHFWPYVYREGRLNPRFRRCIRFEPFLEAREWARPYMAGRGMDFIALVF